MSNKTLADLANGFGIVTVMNARIYTLKSGFAYVGRNTGSGALTPAAFEDSGLYLDTLKIANITMEGPTKTITGGQYSNPLIKYGKTMTMEMQDALGRSTAMTQFFGCEVVGGRISVGDKFPGAFAIEGDTFFIDQESGDKVTVHIFIPQFLPDGIFNLTQDAEGDATVFDLNGSVNVTEIKDSADGASRSIFYEIRDNAFFEDVEDQLAGAKAEAIGAYRSACVALGAAENPTSVAAIKSATAQTGIDSALKDAIEALQRPATT